MTQVWRCKRGHTITAPKGVRYLEVTCGTCAKATLRNAPESEWAMTLVEGKADETRPNTGR